MDIKQEDLKIIISGGGTGGHIFPAISIANALKEIVPKAQILFVGANGKMEMDLVPKEGYDIVGLPIRGFQRKKIWTLPATSWRLVKSLVKARRLLKKEKPDVVIGVGGYASAAVLYQATKMRIPTLIQEQNYYPGVTNKILANKVDKICVAYDKMERFLPREKLIFTGNPIRSNLLKYKESKEDAYKYYNLDKELKTILCVGGSLGAKTLNDSVLRKIYKFEKNGVQILWQTGEFYYDEIIQVIGDKYSDSVKVYKFLDRMDLAYAVADLVVSRAGAITISELSALGKATILIPSPNVAEDHQTKNAKALLEQEATVLIRDSDADNDLVNKMLSLVVSEKKIRYLENNIKYFGRTDAAKTIANEALKLIKLNNAGQ